MGPSASPGRRPRAIVFIPLFALTSFLGLGGGFVGALLGSDLQHYVPGFLPSSTSIVLAGVLVGFVVAIPQTVLVFRATGSGRLWPIGTAVGTALGFATFLWFTRSTSVRMGDPSWNAHAFAVMGALVGAGQAVTVWHPRMIAYPLACGVALAPWFAIFTTILTSSNAHASSFLLAVGLPSLLSALIVSVALFACLPRPPAQGSR